MANKEKNVVLNFKMDGQVEYAETLKDINRVMNVAAKEYKNHIAAMGKDASATDKLAAEKKKLEIQMEGAQKRTQMLRNEYEAMAKDTNTSSAELEKMYGKLLDSERAEMALQKSLDRVNDGLSEQAQESREAQDTLDKLKNESALLEAEQQQLTSSFKLQSSELGDNASEVEKVGLAQKQLTQQMKLTDRTVQNLEKQLDATKRVYGENSVEAKQMEAKLNEAKTTVNQFKKSLEGIEKSGGKAKKSLDGIGKGMQGIAGAAPAAAIGGLVSSMGDYNATLARLNTSASEAGLGMDDVNGAFNEMQLVSRDAESSVEGVNNLIAAGFDPSQITSATQAIAGASIKWSDTLNVEGLSDAVQETIAGGKSIGMFDELLSRSGVNIEKFNEGLKAASESGNQQQYVLDQLTNMGLSGYLDKYKELNPEVVAQQEAQQKMTQSLSELSLTLSPMVTKVAEFTTKLIEWVNENPKLTAGVAAGTAAIGALVAIVGALSVALTPVTAIVAAVAAAIAGVVLVIQNWGAIWDWIGEKTNQFTTWISELISQLASWFSTTFQGIKNAVVQIVTTLVNAVVNWFTNLSTKISSIFSAIGGFFSSVWNGIKSTFSTIISAIVNFVVTRFNNLKSNVSKVFNAVKNFISSVWNGIKSTISNVVSAILSTVSNIFNSLKSKVSSIFNGIKSVASSVWNGIKSTVSGVVKGVKNAVVNTFNGLKSTVSSIWNNIKDAISKPIEKAKELVSSAIDKIKGILDFDFKLPKIKLPHFKLKGKLDLVPPDLSVPKLSVDWRAKGGIFTQPTIFGASNGRLQGAGEAGPEAVLPLNEKTLGDIGRGIAASMKGRSGVTQHITIVSPDPTSPADNARALKRAEQQLAMEARF